MAVPLSEQDYLRHIELLAHEVVRAAQDKSRLDRAVGELARSLRHEHFAGDGCVEQEPLMLHLGGAALLTPADPVYEAACRRLGVEARPEGWALWYTWDAEARAHIMVTTALETTRTLLRQWAEGHDVHPAQPSRAQVAAVVRGWLGPMVLSPSHARTVGLSGR
ncbi:hypothetical protein AB0J83_25910 [Actinoplanes sp. NPDC049596]|uniref:hypothetical protein n=1 Tax=unclassified Actinoplanes TaxID=2626549 RepID=UPI00341B4AFA